MSLYRNLPSHLVFFQDECRKELELPDSWTSMLANVFSQLEVVRGSNSRVWNVQLLKVTEQTREYMSLDFGWEAFMDDNQIHEGEVLIIYYGGNRTFYVRIFSSSMVERFSSIGPFQSSVSSGGIGVADVDFREHLGIGNKPWFPWVITPACFGRDYMDVPVTFGNQVFAHVNSQTEIQVRLGSKTWDTVVKICSKDNGNIHSRIMSGVSEVFSDNRLEYGKVGVVFLRSSDPIVLEIVFP